MIRNQITESNIKMKDQEKKLIKQLYQTSKIKKKEELKYQRILRANQNKLQKQIKRIPMPKKQIRTTKSTKRCQKIQLNNGYYEKSYSHNKLNFLKLQAKQKTLCIQHDALL